MTEEKAQERWKALTEYYMNNPEFRYEYDNNGEFQEVVNTITGMTDEEIHFLKGMIEQRMEKIKRDENGIA